MRFMLQDIEKHRGRIDFCTDNQSPKDPVGALHRCIHAIAHLIEPYAKKAGLPVRFAATKIVEKDPLIEDTSGSCLKAEEKVLGELVRCDGKRWAAWTVRQRLRTCALILLKSSVRKLW